MQKICRELHLQHLMIVRGGSEIIDPTTGAVLWTTYISPETVAGVINFLCVQHDLFFAAETGAFVYSRDGQQDLEFGPGADFKNIKDMPVDSVPKIVVPPMQSVQVIDQLLAELSQQFSDYP